MLVQRRELLYTMATASAGLAMPKLSISQKKVTLRVDALRLRPRLEELSVYGRPEGGTFADGVSRVAYSGADLGGRKYAMRAMAEAGLKPRIDAAGNIFGARNRMQLCPTFCLDRTSIRYRTAATFRGT